MEIVSLSGDTNADGVRSKYSAYMQILISIGLMVAR